MPIWRKPWPPSGKAQTRRNDSLEQREADLAAAPGWGIISTPLPARLSPGLMVAKPDDPSAVKGMSSRMFFCSAGAVARGNERACLTFPGRRCEKAPDSALFFGGWLR
jgi:hypothetical protein